jgi:hypothetical protein
VQFITNGNHATDSVSFPTERSAKTRELREAKKEQIRATAKVNRLERWFKEHPDPVIISAPIYGQDSVRGDLPSRGLDIVYLDSAGVVKYNRMEDGILASRLVRLWDGYVSAPLFDTLYYFNDSQYKRTLTPEEYRERKASWTGQYPFDYYVTRNLVPITTRDLPGLIEYLRKR